MRIKYIQFLLIGEGSSDEGLIEPLSRLCIEHGVDEIEDITSDFDFTGAGHSVLDKLRIVLRSQISVDLIFIHRDADSLNYQRREAEIREAIEISQIDMPYVAVIPIHETEAWLLLDEQAIREIANNPFGRIPLQLPRPQNVEQIADPKIKLQEILLLASEVRGGRRLKEFRKEFSIHRRQLLERLTPDSPVRDVPAWQRLVAAIQDAIQRL